MSALRLLASTAAGVLALWFALMSQQARDLDAVGAAIEPVHPPAASAVAGLKSRLDRAGWLNPDADVDLRRAQLVTDLGRLRAGRTIIERVLAREPDNLDAWALLAFVTRDADPPEHRRALAQVRRLAPPVPEP